MRKRRKNGVKAVLETPETLENKGDLKDMKLEQESNGFICEYN